MKQVFIIETKQELTEMELLGCLEDTIGKGVISTKLVDMNVCADCGDIKLVTYNELKSKYMCSVCRYKLKGYTKPKYKIILCKDCEIEFYSYDENFKGTPEHICLNGELKRYVEKE